MPLSTSNFDRTLPDLPWVLIFGTALLVFVVFASLMDIRLAQLGYVPTTLDSKERWAKERFRANELGNRALVLIGASRIQLGIDLETLRRESQLEPIQLAVDGSSFIPVLKNLASDPLMQGTVLIDYNPGAVEGALASDQGASTTFVNEYKKNMAKPIFFSLDLVEKFLSGNLHESLRSYSDGANPLMSLQWRIIPNQRATRYLITHPDRSRLADYKLVSMPDFYYRRVARNLGEERSINIAATDVEQVLKRRIDLLQPHDNSVYIQGIKYIRQLVAEIQSHGGKVLFVEIPTSGMVREIDDKRYPHANFLDLFEKEIGVPFMNSVNNPTLRSFVCPDGSHLDFRDRARFTAMMAQFLGLTSRR